MEKSISAAEAKRNFTRLLREEAIVNREVADPVMIDIQNDALIPSNHYMRGGVDNLRFGGGRKREHLHSCGTSR